MRLVGIQDSSFYSYGILNIFTVVKFLLGGSGGKGLKSLAHNMNS